MPVRARVTDEACLECGHQWWDHHGVDSGVSPHQGCMALGSGVRVDGVWDDSWCHCPLTAQEATSGAVRPQDATGCVQALPVSQRCNSIVLEAHSKEER